MNQKELLKTSRIAGILLEYFPELKLQFVDIGAAGGLDEKILALGGLVGSYGFEPNPREYEKLPKTRTVQWLMEGVAGKDGKRTLHVTAGTTNTSLLEPDAAVLEKYEWGRDHEITGNVEVDCKCLDSICSENNIRLDLLKVDTQGTELEILQGAGERLNDTGFLMIEVEFQPLYKTQPLFREVDHYLSQRGFELLDFGNLLRMKARGTAGRGNMRSRLISADAIYLKKTELADNSSIRLLAAKFSGLLAYGYVDWCLQSLKEPAYQVLGKECIADLTAALLEDNALQGGAGWKRLVSRACGKIIRTIRPPDAAYWTDPWA